MQFGLPFVGNCRVILNWNERVIHASQLGQLRGILRRSVYDSGFFFSVSWPPSPPPSCSLFSNGRSDFSYFFMCYCCWLLDQFGKFFFFLKRFEVITCRITRSTWCLPPTQAFQSLTIFIWIFIPLFIVGLESKPDIAVAFLDSTFNFDFGLIVCSYKWLFSLSLSLFDRKKRMLDETVVNSIDIHIDHCLVCLLSSQRKGKQLNKSNPIDY